MTKVFNKCLLTVFTLILFCQPVFANVILPVVFVTYPFLVLSLLFVVIIEFFYYTKIFTDNSKVKIIKATIIANVVSTLLGVPFAGAPWIAGSSQGDGLHMQIWRFFNYTEDTGPIKILVHICLYCLASFVVESFVIIFNFRKSYKTLFVTKHVLCANLITYSLFAIVYEILIFCDLPFKH